MRRVRITGEQPPLTGVFAVFGRLDEERTAEILGHLRRAEERLFALRDTLVEQTGEAWVCDGVMFEGSEDLRVGGIGASVDGEVDGGEGAVAFVADLLTASHAWECEAEVWVYGEDSNLRGGDPVLELPRQRYHSPEDAAAGYAAICAELFEVALSRPPDLASWQRPTPEGAT